MTKPITPLRVGGPLCNDLRLGTCAVSSFKPAKCNARTHSKKQVHQIAASIQEFGFTNPVLVNASGQIIAGHGRVKAAKVLGLSTVPVVRIEHLTHEQIRAYAIADNKIAPNSG